MITPWIAVTLVSRSSTSALIETFMTLASSVMRNCVRASRPSPSTPPDRSVWVPSTVPPSSAGRDSTRGL